MKARLIIMISFLSVVMLGCSGVTGLMRNSQGTSDYNPHTGSEGIEIRFVQDNPPYTLYDTPSEDRFPILIEVWNKGAMELGTGSKQGWVFIKGHDTTLIQNVANYKAIHPLVGKSAYNSLGGYKILDMRCLNAGVCSAPSSVIALTPGMSEYPLRLQATACYQYRTQASPTVCIDGNPYTGVEDKPCQVGDVRGVGSQGAPVAVTSIEEIAMPGSVQFRIHISNVGGGKVVRESSIVSPGGVTAGTCPGGLGFEDLNQIAYSVHLSGSTGGSCEPTSANFRLVDGNGLIFCTFPVTTTDTYVTPLTITLDYGYMDSETIDLVIHNLQT